MNPRKFRELFIHRDDCYAIQRETGSYFPVDEKLGLVQVMKHLRGEQSIGAYVIRPEDQTVSFIVFDLDTYDEGALAHLVNCAEEFVYQLGGLNNAEVNTQCLLLESSGGKGYHLWLFLSEPLPARQVRAWVVHDFMPQWNVMANDPQNSWPLEVFPKQDTVEPGGYGNLVKLPLGKHAVTGKKSEFLGWQGLSKELDKTQRLDASLVPTYEASTPTSSRSTVSGRVSGTTATARLLRGEVVHGDRHNTFRAHAWHCRQEGLPEDLAWDWTQRLNELQAEPMDDEDLERAFSGAYTKDVEIEPNQHAQRAGVQRGSGDWQRQMKDRAAARLRRRSSSTFGSR